MAVRPPHPGTVHHASKAIRRDTACLRRQLRADISDVAPDQPPHLWEDVLRLRRTRDYFALRDRLAADGDSGDDASPICARYPARVQRARRVQRDHRALLAIANLPDSLATELRRSRDGERSGGFSDILRPGHRGHASCQFRGLDSRPCAMSATHSECSGLGHYGTPRQCRFEDQPSCALSTGGFPYK